MTTYELVGADVDNGFVLQPNVQNALAAGIQEVVNLAVQTGVDPTGVTECAAAIQTVLTAAAASGVRVVANGTFKTASTLTITSECDLADATVNYTGTGTAIQVGNPASLLMRATIRLPALVATAKTVTGWAQVAGSVGVRVSNCYSCQISSPRINNFETGFLGHGNTPNGTSYCTFRLDHIDNCKIGQAITPQSSGVTGTSGWFNQNLFLGGRISQNSGEGSQVSGTRSVLISANTNISNNNVWVGTSLETPDVLEYHIECNGQYNYWDRCRFENTGGDTHRRVYWRAVSKGNVINGGFNAGQITQVVEAGAINDVRSDVVTQFSGGASGKPTLVLENTFSSVQPALTIMAAGANAAGTDPSTGYATQISATQMNGKRAADANARVIVDSTNGRLYVGDATAAPTAYWTGSPSTMILSASTLLFFLTDNAADIGSTASGRPRYVRVGTAVQTGAAVTGSRPSAVTARAGAMFFDTTLVKPIFSDGTVWRDATGAAV